MAQELEQEETKVEVPTPVEFKLSHTHHTFPGTNDYTLSIQIQDSRVQLNSFAWPHKPGHQSEFVLGDLQPSDIKVLGEAIIKEALKIEMEAETPA